MAGPRITEVSLSPMPVMAVPRGTLGMSHRPDRSSFRSHGVPVCLALGIGNVPDDLYSVIKVHIGFIPA